MLGKKKISKSEKMIQIIAARLHLLQLVTTFWLWLGHGKFY